MIKTTDYDYEILSFPNLKWINKNTSKTNHITLFDENGLRMRVNVLTGEIVVKEIGQKE